MMTMEFDDIKKIWDAQNNEPVYGINETALHNRILAKKQKGYHITNTSELLCIVVYALTGCFVLGMNINKPTGSIPMYLLAAWMLVVALYVLVSRLRRINGNKQFDRSMRGDLAHAIAVATYQVRFSLLMRWNMLPIAILIILGVWGSGKSIWVTAGILLFFVLVNYASGWEHSIYKNRKRELEVLREKLESEG